MKGISLEILVKRAGQKAYETVAIWRDPERVTETLAHDLWARYICRAPYIKRTSDRNNYDGTRTIEMLCEDGGTYMKRVYIVKA